MNFKPTIIYIADPMCSWCYGFAPEITRIKNALGDSVKFELIMGGLRPYNTEQIGTMKSFLKKHWHQVEEKSGQPFRDEIFKNESFVYDTEPPSRAVVVVRQLKPEAALDFYKAIQKAFYFDGKDTNKIETYLELLPELAIASQAFKQAFESDEMKEKVRDDFASAKEMGINGFPALVWKGNEKAHLLTYGYADAAMILKKIDLINTDSEN